MPAEYTPGIVRDLQVPNPRGYSVCCLLPGLHVHPRQDHDCTIHQWDCKLSEQQDGGTRRYVSTEDFQVWVCILILLSDPHLGMPPPFHLGKGGGPLLQYQVECPHLSEAHLTTGTPQEKGERGNPSSAPVAPAGKWGRCSHCWSQTVDPTAKHPTLPIHCRARVPQRGSGWPSTVVLRGN